MAVSLARPGTRPAPQTAAQQWALLCSIHAKALRLSADGASPLQAERAVVEYGAAVVLEKAAVHWRAGDHELGLVWMRAAENQLAAALITVPWS